MKPRLANLVFSWAILSGYALLAVLGHGGTHWLLGDAGCSDHRPGTHLAGTAGHGHAGHSHGTCCQHRPVPTPTPEAPAPKHDPDHCSIGVIFETPLTLASLFELPGSVEVRGELVQLRNELEVAARWALAQPRAPPVV